VSEFAVFWLGFAAGGATSMTLGFVVLLVTYFAGAHFANSLLGNTKRKGGSNV
jgi:hypothetical protein